MTQQGYKKQTSWLKDKLFGFIVIIALIAITITLCVFGVKINKLDKTDEISARNGWEKGVIAVINGEEVKGTTAIRTKEYVPIRGLFVDMLENSGITYQGFFYDKDLKFISATEELTEDFENRNIPENAAYVRFMIIPQNDPEVSTSEIKDYASGLIIEFAK